MTKGRYINAIKIPKNIPAVNMGNKYENKINPE